LEEIQINKFLFQRKKDLNPATQRTPVFEMINQKFPGLAPEETMKQQEIMEN